VAVPEDSPPAHLTMAEADASTGASRSLPPIFTRQLLLIFVADLGSLTSFFLLLSVVPLYATSNGAGRAGAGLATAALTFATVVGELVSPRLVRTFGYRGVFGAGTLLLGLPSLALVASASMPVIVVASIIRGGGFAFTVVAGSAVIAALIPPDRRGEGLGLYGVGSGVPSVVALPLGVWLAGHADFPVVFVAGAVTALAGIAALPVLPGRGGGLGQSSGEAVCGDPIPATAFPSAEADGKASPRAPAVPDSQQSDRAVAVLRDPGLIWPSVIFGITAMAAGATVTFVPIALRTRSDIASLALLALPAAAALARWYAGRHGDRYGPARLLLPGVAVVAAGIFGVALSLSWSPDMVIAAVLVFGVGFGTVQNSSLTLMYSRMPASRYAAVSAFWNVAYDAGLGAGASVFGVLAAHSGYSATFALAGVLMLAALVPAWRVRASLWGPKTDATRRHS
jgi:predicted MFS family arabinose efflux permease